MSTGCFFVVTPFNYLARYLAGYRINGQTGYRISGQTGYQISGKTDWPDIRPIQYPVQPYQEVV